MSGKRFVNATALLILSGASTCAHALLEDCEVTATPLAFGSYDPLNASPTDATGTISITCTVTLISLVSNWELLLSAGASGNFLSRQMNNGASPLLYNLYTNAARTTIWGDGTAGTSTLSDSTLLGVGTSTRNYTVYGRLPAGQDQPPGSYADTITVTLNF